MNIGKIRYYLFSVMYIVFLALFAVAVSKKYDDSGYNESKQLFFTAHKKLKKEFIPQKMENNDFAHLASKLNKLKEDADILDKLLPEFLTIWDDITIEELEKKKDGNKIFADENVEKKIDKLHLLAKKYKLEVTLDNLDNVHSLIGINKLAIAYFLCVNEVIENFKKLTPFWIGSKPLKPVLTAVYKNKTWQDSTNQIQFFLSYPLEQLTDPEIKISTNFSELKKVSTVNNYNFLDTREEGKFNFKPKLELAVNNYSDNVETSRKINYEVVKPLYIAATSDDEVMSTLILFKSKSNYYKLYKGGEFLGEFPFQTDQKDFLKEKYNLNSRIMEVPNYQINLIDNKDNSYSISLYKHPYYERITKEIGSIKECLVIEKSRNRLIVNVSIEDRLISLKNPQKNDQVVLKINGQKVVLNVR